MLTTSIKYDTIYLKEVIHLINVEIESDTPTSKDMGFLDTLTSLILSFIGIVFHLYFTTYKN